MANAIERAAQSAVHAVTSLVQATPGGPIDPASLRKILVVRVDDRVGNVLLTTPLIRALRAGLPNAEIHWLLAGRRRLLVEGLSHVDRLLSYDKSSAGRRPWAFASMLWRLRRERYDAVIEAAHFDVLSTTQALLARWTGAPVRIGPLRGDAPRYYTHPVPIPDSVRNDVAARLQLLRPLGLPEQGRELETTAGLAPDVQQSVEAMLRELGLEAGGFILANPGARKLDRRFPPEQLGLLLKRLAEASGHTALVLWGPGEEALAEAAARAGGDQVRKAPPTDLHQLAALLRRSALLVTNDTGPMHLGVACGAPTLALFTVPEHVRWGHALETFRAVDATTPGPETIERAFDSGRALLKR